MNQTPQTLPTTEFRRQVGEYINRVYYAKETFLLTKGEKPFAALVPMATLDRLAELERFYATYQVDQPLASAEPITTEDS